MIEHERIPLDVGGGFQILAACLVLDVDDGGVAGFGELQQLEGGAHGRMGAGSVHHIAFRAADDAAQLEWRKTLAATSLDVTPVLDRTYFRSIYFREPGGVLFEIATDPPGFALDEPIESLGEALKLPHWLERNRSSIERVLPPIALHTRK